MNTKLLNQVANAILGEPRKFDMDWWFLPSDEAACGSAACIAGWACAISKGLNVDKAHTNWLNGDFYAQAEATQALRLSFTQAKALLFADNWPDDFMGAYETAKSMEQRAEVAFWRIQHFIATEGKE